MADIKEIGTGIIQLAYADEKVLKNGYPFLRANIEKFNKAHPSLPEEMYHNPQGYVEELNKVAEDFCNCLLNQSQLYSRYYELVSRIGGVLTYQTVTIEIMKNEISKLKEKLSRYENND